MGRLRPRTDSCLDSRMLLVEGNSLLAPSSKGPSPRASLSRPRDWLEEAAGLEECRTLEPPLLSTSSKAAESSARGLLRVDSPPKDTARNVSSFHSFCSEASTVEGTPLSNLPQRPEWCRDEWFPDLIVCFSLQEGGWWKSSQQFKNDLLATFSRVFTGWRQEGFEYEECERLAGCSAKVLWRRDVQRAVITDLMVFLHRESCTTEVFLSCDKDELFLCIALGDPTQRAQDDPVALLAAQQRQLQVQTDLTGYDPNGKFALGLRSIRDSEPDRPKAFSRERDLVADLGSPCMLHQSLDILQATNPNEELFVNFHPYVVNKLIQLAGLPLLGSRENRPTLLKRYTVGIAGTDGSILRTIDRVRLLVDKINDFVDLDDLLTDNLANSYYVPHKYSKLKEFRNGKLAGERYYDRGHPRWSSFRCETLFGVMLWGARCAQPIQEIRDYFGESMAFYFLWLGYTARCVSLTVPFCIVLDFMHSAIGWMGDPTPTKIKIEMICKCLAVVIFSLGAMLYLKFWRRLESYYMALWNSHAPEIRTSYRPDYRGMPAPDPLDEWGRPTKSFPTWKAHALYVLALGITVLFMLLVIVSVMLVYYVQPHIPLPWHPDSIVSAAFSFQIIVYQLLWQRFSARLVDFANPRTDGAAKNLAVQFLFPLSFISAYTNILFHGFFSSWGSHCLAENCMTILRPGIYQVVTPAMGMQVVSMAIPFFKYRYSLYDEQHSMKRSGTLGVDAQVQRCFIEAQAKRPPFTPQCLNSEMNVMVIMCGYVLLFGFVAPGIAFAVMCTFLLKIRIDAFKMCAVYRRFVPLQTSAQGIGEWDSVLRGLVTIGRYCACTMGVFNTGYLNLPANDSLIVYLMNGGNADARGLTLFQKIALMFLLEQVLAALCRAIEHSISDESAETTLMSAKRAKVHAQMTLKLASSEPRLSRTRRMEDQTTEEWRALLDNIRSGNVDDIPVLDGTHRLWDLVAKGDFSPVLQGETYFGA